MACHGTKLTLTARDLSSLFSTSQVRFVEGIKNQNYHFKGKPYLDGFKAIAAPKMAVRLSAIRGDRAAIEFRGFPPKARDDLVKSLGDEITVQESDWNCVLLATPKPKA